jgi:hypothetical protein
LSNLPIISKTADDHGSKDGDASVGDGIEQHQTHPAPTLEVQERLKNLLPFEDFGFEALLIGSKPLHVRKRGRSYEKEFGYR